MSQVTVLYGIKNCDTVKKARKWLESREIDYHFHDFRADGLSKNRLQGWIDRVGSDSLINTRSTTWKQLSARDQDLAMSKIAAAVVLANPTLIKRPVLEHRSHLLVGFKPEEFESVLGCEPRTSG